MGRKSFDISNYVAYDPMTNKSQCLFPNCGKMLCGKRNANVRRHYMLMHGTVFNEYGQDVSEATDDALSEGRSNSEYIVPQYMEEVEESPTSTQSRCSRSKDWRGRFSAYSPIKIEDDDDSPIQTTYIRKTIPGSLKDRRSQAAKKPQSVPVQRYSETYATEADIPKSPLTSRRHISLSDSEDMAKLDEKIGFIGGGNMAFAIGSGLISRGIVKPGQVLASGPNLENLCRWRDLGAEITEDNYEVLDKSDVIFVCVKPHILTPCATQLRSIHEPTTKDKEKLFVSVLAGVNLKTLEESFNFVVGLKMIRTMPNTSMQVGEGCTVYTAGTYVKQQDLEKVHLMLNSLGIAQQVPESMIDAVTGVAGCGPAYVYTFIESLADGAVKEGVPRQMALQFAAQTVLGAAKTVLMTGKHPAVLRDEVCSPGGSTIVGVHELEKGNFRATVINAVEKSSKRSAELGKK